MGWQRPLQQDSGDRAVLVESVDPGDQLLLGHRGRQVVQVEADPEPLAGSPLVADIDRRSMVIPDIERDQARLLGQFVQLEAQAFQDGGREGTAVDLSGSHAGESSVRVEEAGGQFSGRGTRTVLFVSGLRR